MPNMKRIGEMIERVLTRIEHVFGRIGAAVRGRYVRALEDDVARLRAENRALLNSLLGTAGFPPLGPEAPRGPLVNAVRRRSWPQIAMQRELQEQQRRGPVPPQPQARDAAQA
jgi:hypothetical protein